VTEAVSVTVPADVAARARDRADGREKIEEHPLDAVEFEFAWHVTTADGATVPLKEWLADRDGTASGDE